MRLRLTEFRPRTGPYVHRVVQPRTPLRHTSLRTPRTGSRLLMGDHDGLNRLAGLFSFAARSRHTIVHVPLRDGVPPDEGCGEPVDLVLAHPEAGLRPAKWPELRGRLRHGTPLTVRTDEARTARDARAWEDRGYGRSTLSHATHARTCFLVGDRAALASAATAFAYAAGFGPRAKGVAQGHAEFVTGLRGLLAPDRVDGSHPDLVICFKPYPPYAHFKRPGR